MSFAVYRFAASPLRQIIDDASELLKARRRERDTALEVIRTRRPMASGEFIYEVKTLSFPLIKGHLSNYCSFPLAPVFL
jgi:hypothetical protein